MLIGNNMNKFDLDSLPRAEKYYNDIEFARVEPGQWVISLGMFTIPGCTITGGGCLWKVIEILPRYSKWDYLKAVLEDPADGSRSELSLSMLYVLPEEPDAEFIAEYSKHYLKWLNEL